MLALGQQPSIEGSIADEEFFLNQVEPGTTRLQELINRKTDAARMFLQANNSRSIRAAMLARSRPQKHSFEIGDWVYYWRKDGDPKLQKSHSCKRSAQTFKAENYSLLEFIVCFGFQSY